MVFTHLPANVFLVLAGLSPYAWLAVLLLDAPRLALPDGRARTAGPRHGGRPTGGTGRGGECHQRAEVAWRPPRHRRLAGWFLANGHLAAPLVIAGVAKGTYDLLFLWRFRGFPVDDDDVEVLGEPQADEIS